MSQYGQIQSVIDGTTRKPVDVIGTNGAAHVSLPHDLYGTLTKGEIFGNGAPATTTTISFPNGIIGFSITVGEDDKAATETAQTFFVAFNNHAFSDPTVAGLRYVVFPGQTLNVPFNPSLKPTEVYVRTAASSDILAAWTAVEEA